MLLWISGLFIFASYCVRGSSSTCPHTDQQLQRWSNPASWPTGQVPVSGSAVSIGRAILLDVPSVTVSELNVVGSGRLVFSDDIGDITITADGILVKDSGSLVIGSEHCRFQNKVNIRLTGSRTTDRTLLDGKGEKYIAVTDQGSLQIYGQEKTSWTKLTRTIDRWQNDEETIIYSHEASPFNFMKDRYTEGLNMYVFYPCNEQPRYYRGYDFDQGGNTAGEQRVVNEMIEALNGVEDGQIVAIATQRRYRTTADLTGLFNKLESMSGISRLALRDSQEDDAFALVFQLGGDAHQAFDPMIGKEGQVARASIVVNDTKVSAISYMKSELFSSKVDFRVLHPSAGFPTISVTDDISSWNVGDEVILTSTDYSLHHTEVRTIKEITSSNKLKLSDEMDFRHFGKIEDGVDMRAEVALLTRNIKIEGVMSRGCPEVNRNCDEFEYDTYGAHVKIFGFDAVHIEGVEFVNVGQTTDNGFYPVHFHMCQDISGKEAIVKANSFHNSYARAITIHGTWGQSETLLGVQILDNVAYDIIGHCYFLEDGAEKATILDGNLGATIRSVNGNGFATDKSGPSVFWITNPKVILTNNVAVGAKGFGIWYVFPDEPVGPSMGLGAFALNEAKHTPLWTFDNNVVHSNERGGMNFESVLRTAAGDVDGSIDYEPVQDPFNPKSEPVKVQLTRLTAYKNWRINTWLRGGHFELIQYSRNRQRIYVTKSIFVGRTRGNSEDDDYPDTPKIGHYFGIIFYDGPVFIDRSWFNGFTSVADKYAAGALGFVPKKTFHDAYASNVTDLRFGFVDKADGTGGNRVFDGTVDGEVFGLNGNIDDSATFRDGLGSMTHCPGSASIQPTHVLRPEEISYTENCMKRDNWQMIVCENNYGKITLGADNGFDTSESQVKRLNRQDPLDVAYDKNSERKAILGSDKYYYQLQFTMGFPRKVTIGAKGVENGHSVVAGICLPAGVTLTDVNLFSSRPPGMVTSTEGWRVVDTIDEVFADNTMSRVFVDGRTIYVNFVSKIERDLHWDKHDWENCPSGSCPFFNVELSKGVTVTDYTPCFTPPDSELNDDVGQNAMTSMSCDLPASLPEDDWGAGNTRRKAIQAQWGEWGSWSECCGDEDTYRYRLCDEPIPHGTAATCHGDSEEVQPCPVACPVDGVLGQWSRWSDCFCDGIAVGSYGAKTRTRVCDLAGNGGDFCWGALTENRPCYGDCI